MTGIGPNGEKLSGSERAATVVATGLPIVPGSVVRKALGVASTLVDDALDLVTRADDAADAAKDVVKGSASANPGSFGPPRSLPRDEYGEMIPDSPYPHTQLGTENGRPVGDYTVAREFGEDGEWQRDIHFTDHGRPVNHTNPHQHMPVPNPTGGTPGYGPAVPFDPSNP